MSNTEVEVKITLKKNLKAKYKIRSGKGRQHSRPVVENSYFQATELTALVNKHLNKLGFLKPLIVIADCLKTGKFSGGQLKMMY